MQFLVITLRGPMAAFPGPIIDGFGNTGRLPRLSAICGLLANALGYERRDYDLQDELQRKIVFAAREDIPGVEMMDFQTAQIGAGDKGWTYRGIEGRTGGADTYKNPTLLQRPFLAEHVVTLVVGLQPGSLTIDRLKDALEKPARPLFLGRKAFLPSAPLLDRSRPIMIEADTALEAIKAIPGFEGASGSMRACWPAGLGSGREVEIRDLRDFRADRHAGSRKQMEGRISVAA